MKYKTPLISWHRQEPIFSVDFCSSDKFATGGADGAVRIWKFTEEDLSVKLVSNLERHTRGVNVVRFSPCKTFLASGSDDGTVLIWHRKAPGDKENQVTSFGQSASDEWWGIYRGFSGHTDVYDLAWSPCGTYIAVGSTDNTARVWDTVSGKSRQTLTGHNHYVQGISWDPLGIYLVTQSSDQSVRVYKQPKAKSAGDTATAKQRWRQFRCCNTLKRIAEPPPETNTPEHTKKTNAMFRNESLPTFFRRNGWSPDGKILVVPSGKFPKRDKPPGEEAGSLTFVDTTFVYSRHRLTQPAGHLPTPSSPSVAVRFNPRMFSLVDSGDRKGPFFHLDYRMVFAVATLDGVLIYDTEQRHPIASLKGTHYASVTDIAWSCSGETLVIASMDGYCTFIRFTPKDDLLGDCRPEPEHAHSVPDVARDNTPECLPSNPKKKEKKKEDNHNHHEEEHSKKKVHILVPRRIGSDAK